MYEDRRATYVESIIHLVGHLAGTAFVFAAFICFGWLISFGLHFLHGVHPFPPEVFALFLKIELGLVYFDAVLCTVVFTAGGVRFWKNITR